MSCLIEINRTTLSVRTLYEAATRHGRCGSVCLVHTIASGRPAEVEAGQRLLLEAARALRLLDRDLPVEARLEIGDTAARLLAVTEEIQPDLIVMSAHGEGEFPRLQTRGRTAQRMLEGHRVPVLLVSPVGDQLCRPHRLRGRRRRPTPPRFQASRRLAPSSLQTPAAPL